MILFISMDDVLYSLDWKVFNFQPPQGSVGNACRSRHTARNVSAHCYDLGYNPGQEISCVCFSVTPPLVPGASQDGVVSVSVQPFTSDSTLKNRAKAYECKPGHVTAGRVRQRAN